MKKTLLMLGVGIFLTAGIFTALNANQVSTKVDNNTNKAGCCSRHGGVCGCSSGQAKCCDGTLSPSCTCAR